MIGVFSFMCRYPSHCADFTDFDSSGLYPAETVCGTIVRSPLFWRSDF